MNDITYEIRDGEHLPTEDEWRDLYAQEERLDDHHRNMMGHHSLYSRAGFDAPPYPQFVEWATEMLQQGTAKLIFAKDGGKMIGHIQTGVIYVNGVHNEIFRGADKKVPQGAYITMLYVDNQYRSHGIGTQLIQRSLQLCKQAGSKLCYLTVNLKNSRARALYERLGFKTECLKAYMCGASYSNSAKLSEFRKTDTAPFERACQLVAQNCQYVAARLGLRIAQDVLQDNVQLFLTHTDIPFRYFTAEVDDQLYYLIIGDGEWNVRINDLYCDQGYPTVKGVRAVVGGIGSVLGQRIRWLTSEVGAKQYCAVYERSFVPYQITLLNHL